MKKYPTGCCLQCKSDEAFGIMGRWYQCLMCGFIDKDYCEDLN